MAVYVDNVRIEWRGRLWCHMVADSLEELHEFAKRLGLQRAWFQHAASYPHYDVTVVTRMRALKLGASSGNRVQIITCARKLKAELVQHKPNTILEQLSLFDWAGQRCQLPECHDELLKTCSPLSEIK